MLMLFYFLSVNICLLHIKINVFQKASTVVEMFLNVFLAWCNIMISICIKNTSFLTTQVTQILNPMT